jgi:predicted transcriptional regulator
MSVDRVYAPRSLEEQALKGLSYVLESKKAKRILSILLEKKSLYLNEIQNKVGGSKTNTVEALKTLEKLRIVKSDWKIEQFEDKGGPKTRAVKAFQITDNKYELLDFYEPILKSSS